MQTRMRPSRNGRELPAAIARSRFQRHQLSICGPRPRESGAPRLLPIYERGRAYLMLHNGNAAAAEFQKVIDHPGIVREFPVGALAHLGLARAYALQGDAAKSRAAYQDFLTLWRDADPGIPILKEAKSEYAKLQ